MDSHIHSHTHTCICTLIPTLIHCTQLKHTRPIQTCTIKHTHTQTQTQCLKHSKTNIHSNIYTHIYIHSNTRTLKHNVLEHTNSDTHSYPQTQCTHTHLNHSHIMYVNNTHTHTHTQKHSQKCIQILTHMQTYTYVLKQNEHIHRDTAYHVLYQWNDSSFRAPPHLNMTTRCLKHYKKLGRQHTFHLYCHHDKYCKIQSHLARGKSVPEYVHPYTGVEGLQP